MHDSCSLPPEDDCRRSAALISFLGAGLDQAPSRVVMVTALADARRAVAMLQSREEPIVQWLAREVRFRGVRENAATLAALEVSSERDAIVNAYRDRYPQRADQLDDVMAWL